MWFLGMLVGLFVGAWIGRDLWLLGAAVGGIAGFIYGGKRKDEAGKLQALADEVTKLTARVAFLERRQPPPSAEPAPERPVQEVAEPPAPEPVKVTVVQETPKPAPEPEFVRKVEVPQEPNFIVKWLLGGNTVVRVGIVILFFGLAFLLKYAYEHTHVPLELRLAGVAVGGIVLLVLGWRFRAARPGYALALQGGGIGVLYLTIFGAFRLYSLIPAGPAFVLLIGVAAFSAAVAVMQNSLSLAVLGVSGGFLAPVLASTGQGSHVMLFSYYMVLNLGILAVAWYKAWRVLNVVGFAFTFVIATLWGVTRYTPELFASTEPFLVANFLLYIAIPLLFARRQAFALRDYVDGTLVFGTPLVAFGLQAGLVKEFEYGAAISAFVLAAFYLVLASSLWRRAGENLRLLTESYLALGVVFATLAIPLAFDGRITSAAWALEGAAIVWVSVRQKRTLGRLFGIALQFAAGAAFLFDVQQGYGPVPVLNSAWLGCLFIAVGAIFTAAYLDRRKGTPPPPDEAISGVLLAWGALWWAGGGLHEIERHAAVDLRLHMALAFLAASCAAFSILATRLAWPKARWPAYLVAPLAAFTLVREIDRNTHPFIHWGWAAWPFALGVNLWILRRHEPGDPGLQRWLHAAGVWIFAVVLSWEFAWQIDQAVEGRHVWPLIAWAMVPALALISLTAAPTRRFWPLAAHGESYIVLGAVPVTVFLILWTLIANFTSNGDPAPLPYVPLLNPLDLAQAVAFVAAAYWILTLRQLGLAQAVWSNPAPLYAVFGVTLFIWANGALLRTLHHWADVPFRLETMVRSTLVQAALSIFWSVLALGLMTLATRRGWRPLWITGAVLMAVVVGKLFLVDLSNVGTVERIVSFIGVGALMLVIGYFSPVPPKTAEAPK
jgi:uncharacterized membrane protein